MGFIVELWNSILTPGTTPALVKATHASFAALMVTVLGLLIATKNIHFVFLSLLSGALWIAITWFISEIEQSRLEAASESKPAEPFDKKK